MGKRVHLTIYLFIYLFIAQAGVELMIALLSQPLILAQLIILIVLSLIYKGKSSLLSSF